MDPAFWGLDPLFWTTVKLFAKDILNLVELPDGKDVFKFFDHHIRFAQLCGVVVGIQQTSAMMIYIVDDATGVLPCIRWKNNITEKETISMGDCVNISGRITTYNDTRQIKVYDIAVITNPNVELIFSLEVMELQQNYYSKPFCVPKRITKHQNELKQELEIEKNVLPMVLSQEMKQNMEDVLLDYLQKKFGTTISFSIADIQSDTMLHDLIRPFLSQNQQNPSLYQFKESLSKTFHALQSQGNFTASSLNGDRFLLLDEHDLELEILHAIRSTIDKHGHQNMVGVNHKYICNKVQERFKQLPAKKISNCIYNLDENSIIYRTNSVGKGVDFCDYMIMDDL